MHPTHEILNWIHIIAGGIMLLLGLVLIVMPGKGMLRHKQVGRAFVAMTTIVVLTAVIVISFFRFTPFLLAIAVLSAYFCFTGVRVFSRKRPGMARPIDWVGAGIAGLSGLGLLGYAIWVISSTDSTVLGMLSAVFGIFLMSLSLSDIRDFRRTSYKDKMWWWYHHMSNMLGAWIASLTAFLVQNGDVLFPGMDSAWLLWVAPGVIGGVAISSWVGKFRKKFEGREI
jgi:hypothetical protein